jgi:hypothetical protein
MDDKMEDKKSAKNPQKNRKKYFCKFCHYTTCDKKDYTKHLQTAKHKRMTRMTTKSEKSAKMKFICECGKEYKYRQGLHKHQQKCSYIDEVETDEDEIDEVETDEDEIDEILVKKNDDPSYKELFMEAMKTMQEQAKTINELQENNSKMIPLIGNNNNNTTNNQFNLQFYLNETCKDALNLTDFINSLQVQLKDLEYTTDNGHIKGITNIFQTALSKIEETKRPMHCTDLKREVLYIKDNDEWHKDDEKQEIKRAVNKVVNKNIVNTSEWLDAHPDHLNTNSKDFKKYVKMTENSLGSGEESEKNKIIKNILKEVVLDKEKD